MSVDNGNGSDVQKGVVKKPSLRMNAISNWGPLVVHIIIGFLLTPYIIGHLGKVQYGIWALVGSFLGYYGLLRLGIGSGIMRYVPFYQGTKNNKAASEIVCTGFAIFLATGSIIFLTSMLLAEPIARFYKAGPELALLIRILGVAAALECPMRLLDACIRSHEHWVAANLISIITAIARALGLAGCVYFGYGVVELGYVVLAVTFLSIVLEAILFIRFCSNIQLHPSMVKLSHTKVLLSFGILTTIITLTYTLTLQGHSLIIGKLISLEAVTIYAIPALLIQNARRFLVAPARVFWPRFAYLDGTTHSEEVTSLFLRGNRLTAILASGIVVFLFTMGPSFIHLWIGEDFRTAHPILLILAAGYLIENSQALMAPLLGGTGRQGTQAIFSTIEGIIGIGLSIMLVKEMGMIGAAIGYVISVVLIRGIVCPWYICRLLDTGFLRYYTNILLRPWLVLGILTLGFYKMGISEFVNNWLALISTAMIVGILYLLCTYLYVIRPDERRNLTSYIRQRISLLKVRGDSTK